MKVFLGGTCNGSTWRDNLINHLKIGYFNPVVDDWTEECMKEEIKQREECDFCLYTITPKMTGVYSIAEVVEDSIKRPDKTIFCLLAVGDGLAFDKGQIKSLTQVGKMVERNGGKFFTNLVDVAHYLNSSVPETIPGKTKHGHQYSTCDYCGKHCEPTEAYVYLPDTNKFKFFYYGHKNCLPKLAKILKENKDELHKEKISKTGEEDSKGVPRETYTCEWGYVGS